MRQPIATSSTPVTGQKIVEAMPPMMVSSAIAWRERGPAICTMAMLDGVLSASVEATPISAQQAR